MAPILFFELRQQALFFSELFPAFYLPPLDATLSKNALPVSVNCLPDFFGVLTFSTKPAFSACCKLNRIIFPAPFLNSGGLWPLSFLPPYLVRSLSTPTIPLI